MKKIAYCLVGGLGGALCAYGIGTAIIAVWVILVSLSQDAAHLLQPIKRLLDHPYIDVLFITLIILGLILGIVLGYKLWASQQAKRP